MRPRTTTTTTATALALAVFLGGCGSDGEPTESTSTASGPSSSAADAEEAAMTKDAEQTYREFWTLRNDKTSSDAPGKAERALMTDEAFQNQAEFSETAAPTKAVGRDKLLGTKTTVDWNAGGPTATIEVCYEVHRKHVLTENVKNDSGKTLKKGEDIRTDPDGKPIKAGTEMVNLVTMKRDRDDDAPWEIHATEVGSQPTCSEGAKKNAD